MITFLDVVPPVKRPSGTPESVSGAGSALFLILALIVAIIFATRRQVNATPPRE